jgi:hypothetical protein
MEEAERNESSNKLPKIWWHKWALVCGESERKREEKRRLDGWKKWMGKKWKEERGGEKGAASAGQQTQNRFNRFCVRLSSKSAQKKLLTARIFCQTDSAVCETDDADCGADWHHGRGGGQNRFNRFLYRFNRFPLGQNRLSGLLSRFTQPILRYCPVRL